MKNISLFATLVVLGSSFFTSCSPKTDTEHSTASIKKVRQSRYNLNTDSTTLTWTAFKTTQRIGVGGSFDSFAVVARKSTGTIQELLQNAEIKINTSSVKSKNEIRDPKIVAFFFGQLAISDEIRGTIDSVVNNDVFISITMNGIKKAVQADYSIANGLLTIDAIIHLPDWNAQSALSALNTECNDLHKGEDGVSKLWPEVAVHISCSITEVE
jgi:hypothetical protein